MSEAETKSIPHFTFGDGANAYDTSEGEESSLDEIRAYCKEHLAAYKVPKEIEFRDELPKSTVGKILRRELVQLHKESE